METLKALITVIAVAFGISFLDGAFSWGLSDSTYIIIGIIELVCIIWALRIVYRKQ